MLYSMIDVYIINCVCVQRYEDDGLCDCPKKKKIRPSAHPVELSLLRLTFGFFCRPRHEIKGCS